MSEKRFGRFPWGNGTPTYEMGDSDGGLTINILKPNYHFLRKLIRVEIPTKYRDILEDKYPGILLSSGKDGDKFGWCYVDVLLRKDELETLKEFACNGGLISSMSLEVMTIEDDKPLSALFITGYMLEY